MSTQMNKDVSCPHCGAAVKTQMWPGIDAQENPELRTHVLDETLFDWKCPACGYEAQFVYPCLYHDKDQKYMIYIVPNGNDCTLQSVDVGETFPQLNGMVKRVVTSLAGLKEKILIFEAGLNDYAVELVKLALTDVAEKKHGKTVSTGYFCSVDQENGRIEFSFSFREKKNRCFRARAWMFIINHWKLLKVTGFCLPAVSFSPWIPHPLRKYCGFTVRRNKTDVWTLWIYG